MGSENGVRPHFSKRLQTKRLQKRFLRFGGSSAADFLGVVQGLSRIACKTGVWSHLPSPLEIPSVRLLPRPGKYPPNSNLKKCHP